MKGFLKGVKRFMKNTTEKIVENVDKVLADEIKCRKIGVLIMFCGVGIGAGLVAISYIK